MVAVAVRESKYCAGPHCVAEAVFIFYNDIATNTAAAQIFSHHLLYSLSAFPDRHLNGNRSHAAAHGRVVSA
jgi:hypothetical protein